MENSRIPDFRLGQLLSSTSRLGPCFTIESFQRVQVKPIGADGSEYFYKVLSEAPQDVVSGVIARFFASADSFHVSLDVDEDAPDGWAEALRAMDISVIEVGKTVAVFAVPVGALDNEGSPIQSLMGRITGHPSLDRWDLRYDYWRERADHTLSIRRKSS